MAGERILIVEDERAVARGLEYGLRAEGFETLSAATGQEALDMAEEVATTIVNCARVSAKTQNGLRISDSAKEKTIVRCKNVDQE